MPYRLCYPRREITNPSSIVMKQITPSAGAVRVIGLVAVIAGAFLVVYGEYDDSPGGMLMGSVIGLVGLYHMARPRRRGKPRTGTPPENPPA